MFDRILVPLDGSRLSEKALPYAVELAKRFSSELVLVRSVPHATLQPGLGPESAQAMEIMIEQTRAIERQNVGRARRYLTLKEQRLSSEKVKVTKHVVLGAPAQAILSECKRSKIDLVVMTTRGHGGLKRAILGSVTDEVVRSPLVPVLVVTAGRRARR
jgi:nucleotide-binding universal stress UspA family protein